MLENKNTQNKKYVLGQFFTPPRICDSIIKDIKFEQNDIVIEPSFGSGNFLVALKKISNKKIGIELDTEIFNTTLADENTTLLKKNFYDFDIKTNNKLIFIGNPPYRTPAYSLTTHKKFVLGLTKKYNIPGIREEAVFFILHTIDIINKNGGNGEIHYILPTSILKNNSKFFNRFKEFLKQQCWFMQIKSLKGSEFDGVAQDLVCLSLKIKQAESNLPDLFSKPSQTAPQKTVLVDNKCVDLDEYLCLTSGDSIPFQKIFKQTFLGSVPCESLLMSVQDEPIEHFMQRLTDIISDIDIDTESLYNKLQYNNKFHLKVFDNPVNSPVVQKKLDIILSYVKNIQQKNILDEFMNIDNYKEINVREGTRFYFRCEKIKKNKNFVYEINPNPCKSFYFTGNPSHSSTDYFGFCDYDINRNVSPGANRTVPVDNLENNLTEFFKKWWRSNTTEPFDEIFNYIIYVSKTNWYKNKKRDNKRFYFAIPMEFIPVSERKKHTFNREASS